MGIERIGVVAYVEENFWDRGFLEDGLECCTGLRWAGRGECKGAEGGDVDEVGRVLREEEECEERDGAVAGQSGAFEVDVEGGD